MFHQPVVPSSNIYLSKRTTSAFSILGTSDYFSVSYPETLPPIEVERLCADPLLIDLVQDTPLLTLQHCNEYVHKSKISF